MLHGICFALQWQGGVRRPPRYGKVPVFKLGVVYFIWRRRRPQGMRGRSAKLISSEVRR